MEAPKNRKSHLIIAMFKLVVVEEVTLHLLVESKTTVKFRTDLLNLLKNKVEESYEMRNFFKMLLKMM